MSSSPADPAAPPISTPGRDVRDGVREVGVVRVDGRRGEVGLDLPVIVHRFGPGPSAVVVANVHGDEAVGVGAVHALDAWLNEHGGCGTVVLYPSVNPQGLVRATRQVPSDALDLNRVFPGSVRGSMASRLAATVWADLQGRQPDLVIDLHADSPDAIPYVIVDRPVRLGPARRRSLAGRLEGLARATGLTVLREYPDDVYLHFSLDQSLAGCVVNQLAVPAITLEVGGRRSLRDEDVRTARDAALGALSSLGSVGTPPVVHRSRVDGVWRRGAPSRPRRAGLLHPVKRPGDRFAAGQVVAEVRDLVGSVIDQLVSPSDGAVVSWLESPWVSAGTLVGTLAVHDDGAL